MPPKDFKIGRMNSRLFIPTESGYQPLGAAQFTEEADTFADDQEPIVKAADSGELTFTLRDMNGAFAVMLDGINKMWKVLQPMLDRVAKDPRTPRLMHLVRYGKNKRIRKKNAKRLVHIMKGD